MMRVKFVSSVAALAALAVVPLWFASCSAPSVKRPSIDANLTAQQNLDKLAEGERLDLIFHTKTYDLPPGVEPAALQRRSEDDAKARRTLAEALSEFAKPTPAPAPIPVPPHDPEKRAEALKFYAKARSAALDGRNLQAMLELQRARELDPASAEILRELARIYVMENRTQQAVEVFEKLIALEPDNVDAMFAIGLASASRRDFAGAVSVLARLVQSGLQLEPGNEILINYTLATSLRELGYDAAFIELAPTALEFSDQLMTRENAVRLASVYRQRGEMWRAVGDACCRLGQFNEALEAYKQSAALPMADPGSLHPRVIYANLSRGTPYTAQRELLAALTSEPTISDRDIRLAAYLKQQLGEVPLLARAMANLHNERPDNASVVRAAATLLPADEGRTLLKNFIARQPRDLQALTDLLAWSAQQDLASAVDVTASLAADNPDLTDQYIDRLLLAVPHASALIKAAHTLPPSPERAFIEVKLLWKAGGLGEAWFACEKARTQWPEHEGLALQQILLAAAMQEQALFERTLQQAPPLKNVPQLLAISQAHRALGQHEKAIQLAEQALAIQPNNDDARVEVARAHLAMAASVQNDATQRVRFNEEIQNAASIAEAALVSSPTKDDAYEVLSLIYMPGGLKADTNDFRNVLQQMREKHPQSTLFARLMAQDFIAQRRFDQAIERLLPLYDSNPAQTQCLVLAVTAWQQAGKLDTAEAWLKERVQQRPHDPALYEQWVRVQLLLRRTDAVLNELKQRANADPNDFLARKLLETVYRAAGQFDAARDVAEQRLLTRPQGVRRELELAALYAGADKPQKSLTHLEWIVANAQHASFDELAGAVRVAGRIETEESRRDELSRKLVEITLEKYPDAPLQVYGLGLLTLARQNQIGEPFMALANRAAEQARGANGTNIESAHEWRELAQALIDAKQPLAAALALRAPLRKGSALEQEAFMILVRSGLITDAAADAVQHEPANVQRSIELVSAMLERSEEAAARADAGADPSAARAEAMYEVSVFYTVIGSRQGAVLLSRETLKFNPDHAMAMNNLGYSMIDANVSDDEALRLVERAYELQPAESNILDTLGWLRYKQGRFDDSEERQGALSLIQQSLASDLEPNPEVTDHLGDVHWRLGQRDRAIEQWKSVVEILTQPGFERQMLERWTMVQRQGWQLLVFDAKQLYDREYGPILERARAKIAAVEGGGQPVIAPTFEEAHTRTP